MHQGWIEVAEYGGLGDDDKCGMRWGRSVLVCLDLRDYQLLCCGGLVLQ